MYRFWLLLLVLFASLPGAAQQLMLKGYVYTSKLEPLPLVEVRVKQIQTGTTTNEVGYFEIPLPEGRYEIVYSATGFQPHVSTVILKANTEDQYVLLTEDKQQLQEVTVSAQRKDKSKDIIRKVIEHKDALQTEVPSYSFDAYIKAFEQKELKTKSKKKKTAQADTMPFNPHAYAQFAEVALKVNKAYPDKIKEERVGLNIKGEKRDFYYLSCTEGSYNFYSNLIRIPSLSVATFLSPLSRSGLWVYRYKYIGFELVEGEWLHHIRFQPGRSSNALLEGEVWIKDEVWAIKKMRAVFPEHQTPAYTFFEATVTYDHIQRRAWLPTAYNFAYRRVSDNRSGQTRVRFEKYNIDTIFDKSFFNTELSATTDSAYHRDSTFWKQVRTEPLTEEEISVIRYKDSVYEVTHSEQYLDSVEQKTNKLTFWKVVWFGPEHANWRKERHWYFPPILSLIEPLHIGGPRLNGTVRYYKQFADKRNINTMFNLSYGFLNTDLRGNIYTTYLYNPFKRSSLHLEAGRTLDNLFWGDSYVNLIVRNGYFIKDRVSIKHRTELINGLYLENGIEFGVRRSIADYKFVNQFDSFLNRSNDIQVDEKPVRFPTYNAFFYELEINYTPHQMYLREPREKVILGSKYPTLYAKWRKGIPHFLGSKIDYDYIEAGIRQEFPIGTFGISTYNLMYGNFINERSVEAADYKRIARGNPGIFFNPMYSFQNMDSTFALFKGFVEGHWRHDFNGSIINKIPYARYLKLFESGGASMLYAPERNLLYGELWVGIEKELRLFQQRIRLGAYGSSSWSNSFQQPFQFKIGLRSYDPFRNRWN